MYLEKLPIKNICYVCIRYFRYNKSAMGTVIFSIWYNKTDFDNGMKRRVAQLVAYLLHLVNLGYTKIQILMAIEENSIINMGTTQRKKTPKHLVEGTDLELSDSFPHVPMHVNVDQSDSGARDSEQDKKDAELGLKGDYGNIALLMFLYILQGIPLGIGGSIPMLLQSRNVSYKDQAVFSFVFWPFSIKLIWAPLVDSLYFTWFGRRKTWLVPIQYLIGLFMMVLSWNVDELLGKEGGSGGVSIVQLTVIFFMLNFLAATQDIAVDGWALTMLAR